MDAKNFGFIDFDSLHAFVARYDKEALLANQGSIAAILRRLNDNEDFRIDFREFARNISPMLPGFV